MTAVHHLTARRGGDDPVGGGRDGFVHGRGATDGFAGIVSGSRVLTLDGEFPVDYLATGDRLITRDGGVAVLSGVRNRTVEETLIVLAPGCLGPQRPRSRTILTGGQPVLMREDGGPGEVVAAASLLGREGVRALERRKATLFHLGLPRPCILYCDGLELPVPGPQSARSTGGS